MRVWRKWGREKKIRNISRMLVTWRRRRAGIFVCVVRKRDYFLRFSYTAWTYSVFAANLSWRQTGPVWTHNQSIYYTSMRQLLTEWHIFLRPGVVPLMTGPRERNTLSMTARCYYMTLYCSVMCEMLVYMCCQWRRTEEISVSECWAVSQVKK